jgi:hypothetical protein
MTDTIKRRPLSRRKYASLVKFYRGVLKDPKASLKLKMSAAIRLDDLYARHELIEARREERQVQQPETPEADPVPAPESADERLQRLLAQYGKKRENQ